MGQVIYAKDKYLTNEKLKERNLQRTGISMPASKCLDEVHRVSMEIYHRRGIIIVISGHVQAP